jgi:hypothetical protein
MTKNTYGAGNRKIRLYYCDFCNRHSIYKPSKGVITPIMECDSCGRYTCSSHRHIQRVQESDDTSVYSIHCYCLECWDRTKQDDTFRPPPDMEEVATHVNIGH